MDPCDELARVSFLLLEIFNQNFKGETEETYEIP
jgi:hypothetical protein